ncbi:unnamed protein product, partial [Bubo scandiacus]
LLSDVTLVLKCRGHIQYNVLFQPPRHSCSQLCLDNKHKACLPPNQSLMFKPCS